MPDSVWDQTELETLILADNGLPAISENIGRLKRLRTLDLGHNLLASVPERLADLDGLTDFLYLHDNCLTSLPPSLHRLKRLRYLNISQNGFTNLPECICGMDALVELRASDNPLATLPDSLGHLSNLRELHLRNTKLKSLPESIGNLQQLRQIDLRGNPLMHLPSAIASLPRPLKKLDLRWVETIEPHSLARRPRSARLPGLSLICRRRGHTPSRCPLKQKSIRSFYPHEKDIHRFRMSRRCATMRTPLRATAGTAVQTLPRRRIQRRIHHRLSAKTIREPF